MQIIVRSLQSTFAVSLFEGATLKDLKAAIEDREFIPSSLQRIVKDSSDLSGIKFSKFQIGQISYCHSCYRWVPRQRSLQLGHRQPSHGCGWRYACKVEKEAHETS